MDLSCFKACHSLTQITTLVCTSYTPCSSPCRANTLVAGSAHLRAGHYWLPAFARPAGQAFVTEREECIDRKLKMIDAFRQQYPNQDFPDALPVRIRDIRIADIMESRGYTHVRYEIPSLETQSGEIE